MVLDRYIVAKYLKTVFFILLLFTVVAVGIDISEKIEDIVEGGPEAKQAVWGYIIAFVLHITTLLLPLYTLIGVIFFVSRMAANSEIIAILNAGVSFNRLLRPFLIGAGIIATIHLLANHFVVPFTNKARVSFEQRFVDGKNVNYWKTDNIHVFVAPNTKVFVRHYLSSDTVCNGFRMETFDEHQQVVSLLKASQAKWLSKEKKWKITDYEVRKIDGLREYYYRKVGQSIDTAINLSPNDFSRDQKQKDKMNSIQLTQFVNNERLRGSGIDLPFAIELNRRSSEPISILVLTVIAVAIAGRKIRGGVGLHLAIGVLIAALFMLFTRFATVFTTSYRFPPAIGIWMPNLLFSLVAVWLVKRAQK